MGYNTPWWMVILLGMGIVFVGLGLLVLLCGAIRVLFSDKKSEIDSQILSAEPVYEEIPNKKRLIAAIVAAIAEMEKTDISALRVVSFKRRNLT